MKTIFVNGRYTSQARTGMQYYAHEVAGRLTGSIEIVRPSSPLRGIRGHLWEQCVLVAKCRNGLLWSPNNTGPLAARRHVCTIHDLFPLDHPEWFSEGFSRWYEWLLPKLAARVAHVIAISEYTKSRLIDRLRIHPSRITVVHNGVDRRFRPPAAEEIQRARVDLKIPFERFVLVVGSIEPRKNVAGMLRAWPQISAAEPELGLVIAGARGRNKVFAQAQFDEVPPNVHFTGYVPHELVPALYGAAVALVYPSLCEGFGLPPLEAMACGAPVICSMNSALPEVVGDAAIGIDPLDPKSIASAVIRVVRSASLQERLRLQGIQQAARFSWERCATETTRVLAAFA